MSVGKDEVAKIINYVVRKAKNSISANQTFTEEEFSKFLDFEVCFQNKKFAEKIKKIVSIILGCSEKDLENSFFKETKLPPIWDKYLVTKEDGLKSIHTSEEVVNLKKTRRPYSYKKIQLTPRYLLEIVGTELGRNLIHPDLWIISLFADYTLLRKLKYTSPQDFYFGNHYVHCDTCEIRFATLDKKCRVCEDCEKLQTDAYPDWIISDLRFKNEAKAIKKREGLIIKILRETLETTSTHQSNLEWKEIQEDHSIENNGTKQDLINKVVEILKSEEII